MDEFTKRVIKTIENIPFGRVMTYGKVAATAGNKQGARQVAWLLHSMSRKYKLPWHRVINAQGKISLKGSDQQAMLESEGIIFNENKQVDLQLYEWEGERYKK